MPESARQSRPPYFPGIQALRAIAALLVVLQHSIVYTCEAAGIGYGDYLKLGFGLWGVMLFFCISGFVIGLNRHLPAGTFAVRRALRIYPAFLATCALSIAILAAIGAEARLDVATALLLPVSSLNDSLRIPYWTLVFEVAFYALAAAAFWFRPTDRALSIAAAAWIVLAQLFGRYFPNEAAATAPGALILVSPYTQLFALGMLACLHQDELGRIDPRAIIAIAAACLFALSTFPMTPVGYVLVQGIVCAGAVVLAARAAAAPAPARWLGDASYGLYLLHLPVIVVLASAFTGSWLARYPLLLFAVIAVSSAAVGAAFGAIEHSAHRRIARVAPARP